MALRNQLLDAKAWASLDTLKPTERDARDLADVANGAPTADSAQFLLTHIQKSKEPHGNQVRYAHHVARYGAPDTTPALLAFVREQGRGNLIVRLDLVKAVQQGTQERGAPVSPELRSLALELAESLLNSSGDAVLKGINLVATFPLPEARGRLQALATNAKAPEPQRLEALSALVTLDPKATIGRLGEGLGRASEPFGVRERAATLLGGIDQNEARAELLKVLPTAPEKLQTTIAVALAARRPGGEALLEAVKTGKASARLLQDNRVAYLLALAGVPDVKEKLAALLKGLPPADQKVNELMDRRRSGFAKGPHDPALGAKLFEKNCAICHQLGGKGARIGPQLDGVGLRGLDRLVEDVLDPSRNVDQAFRLTNLGLKNGQVVSGLLLKEEGEVLVVADAQGKEVRVPKDSVEERTTTQLSPMPGNFAEQVSEGEFADLLAFLLQQQSR